MTLSAAIKLPSAFTPLIMSALAIGVLLVHIAVVGLAPEPVAGGHDEGPAAHLWQILMTAQVPVIAFFVVKWLRKDVRVALSVLGLQCCAYIAALAPVFLLGY